jgi:ATP-binding cassette subfamily B protein
VDTATEQSIQGAMDRLVKGRTTIAIAHRLSTLRNADKLIVMDNGEILEYGTHDELMKRDGEYAKLCKIQASFAKDVAV